MKMLGASRRRRLLDLRGVCCYHHPGTRFHISVLFICLILFSVVVVVVVFIILIVIANKSMREINT